MLLSKSIVNFGEIPLKGVYTDEISIVGGLEDFHYMSGSCFCTKVKLVGSTIKVEFTPSKTIDNLEKGQKKYKPANITIYLDKNVSEFITDEDGVRRLNPDKKTIVIPINYLAVG